MVMGVAYEYFCFRSSTAQGEEYRLLSDRSTVRFYIFAVRKKRVLTFFLFSL